jgi:hypothetical protein
MSTRLLRLSVFAPENSRSFVPLRMARNVGTERIPAFSAASGLSSMSI